MMFWPFAKDSHFPPISMHRNPKAAKAMMPGRRQSAVLAGHTGLRGLAAKHRAHSDETL